MTVVAVVAARDEADRVGATVRALMGVADRVIVVDDASRDATAVVASGAGAEVLVLPRHRGKGGALEAGLTHTGPPEGQVILADADLGETAEHLSGLLGPLSSGEADLVIAVLPPQGGGFGTVKRFARWAIRRLAGLRVAEPLSGQRALTAEALGAIRPLAAGFGVETAMSIDAARRGLRVLEVALPLRHRAGRRNFRGFAHRARQGRDILWAVLVRTAKSRP